MTSAQFKRTMRYMTRTATKTSWLRQKREEAGVSVETATYRLRTVLPDSLWVSSDTVRRNEARERPDPLLAAALLRCYGSSFDDLPPDLAADIDAIRSLLGMSDLGERTSAWVTADNPQIPARTTANVARRLKVA